MQKVSVAAEAKKKNNYPLSRCGRGEENLAAWISELSIRVPNTVTSECGEGVRREDFFQILVGNYSLFLPRQIFAGPISPETFGGKQGEEKKTIL